MKPDFTADNAMFKPNRIKVTVYNDNMVAFTAFSDIFFSIIV